MSDLAGLEGEWLIVTVGRVLVVDVAALRTVEALDADLYRVATHADPAVSSSRSDLYRVAERRLCRALSALGVPVGDAMWTVRGHLDDCASDRAGFAARCIAGGTGRMVAVDVSAAADPRVVGGYAAAVATVLDDCRARPGEVAVCGDVRGAVAAVAALAACECGGSGWTPGVGVDAEPCWLHGAVSG